MNLNYKKVGTGQPLIILHGLFGSLDNWLTLARKLGETYEVFIVDARNHGQSPHANVFNYEVMANDLNDFIWQHQIKNPTILGHSMGGKTAMQFAMNYPNQLSKLIVVDIAPKSYPVHHQTIIDGLWALNFDKIKTRKEADKQLSQYIDDVAIRQFLLKNLYWVKKDQLNWRFNLKAINDNLQIVGQSLQNIKSFAKKTLFIRGDQSNYILKSDYLTIKKIFTNSNVVTFKNTGHWVHAEQPKLFLATLLSFMV